MKKKTNLLFAVATAAMLFISCNKESELENPLDRSNLVTFNATVGNETVTPRMTGTTWTADDNIGVFAVTANTPLTAANIHDGADNIRYTTPGDGIFTAALHTEAIAFPASGSLDFFAYYPYTANVTNFTLALDVSNQINQSAIDVLYSSNATGSAASPHVNLNFRRQMAQLVLNITAGHLINDLTNLVVEIDGLATAGELNLANGDITTTTVGTITAEADIVGGDILTSQAIAILIPEQDLQTATVRFTLGGNVWEWNGPASSTPLASGFRYTYNFELSADALTLANTNSNIADWDGDTMTGGTDEGILTPIPPTDPFFVDNATPTVGYTASSQATINLTALATQGWTATSDAAWLTVTPGSGTGDGALTLQANENTGAERTATVTILADAPSTQSISVTVTQIAAPGAGPALLFPGSDFNDWTAFENSLNSFGLATLGSQSATGGQNGSGALLINGTATSNTILFTVVGQTGMDFTGKSAISFYVKGTTANRSIVVTFPSATTTSTYAFNVLNVGTMEAIITPITGTNNFMGTIDTADGWTKITLDISTIAHDLVTTPGSNFMAFRVGNTGVFDLLVDGFIIE